VARTLVWPAPATAKSVIRQGALSAKRTFIYLKEPVCLPVQMASTRRTTKGDVSIVLPTV